MVKINAYYGESFFGYVRVPETSDAATFASEEQAHEYARKITPPPGVVLRIESLQ